MYTVGELGAFRKTESSQGQGFRLQYLEQSSWKEQPPAFLPGGSQSNQDVHMLHHKVHVLVPTKGNIKYFHLPFIHMQDFTECLGTGNSVVKDGP